MMPYFADKQKQHDLCNAAQLWIDVPYRHLGSTKNGTDCAKFIAVIFREIGIMRHVEENIYYGRDWALNGQVDLIRKSFLDHAKHLTDGLSLKDYRRDNCLFMIPGDILLFKTTENLKHSNHAGIMIGEKKFLHCMERKGVFDSELNYHWRNQLTWVLRVYRTEE